MHGGMKPGGERESHLLLQECKRKGRIHRGNGWEGKSKGGEEERVRRAEGGDENRQGGEEEVWKKQRGMLGKR